MVPHSILLSKLREINLMGYCSMDDQVEEGGSGPLLYSHETRPEVMNPAVGSSGPVGSSPEESHEEDQRTGASLL